jgi:hypothetical protein
VFSGLRYSSVADRFIEAVHRVITSEDKIPEGRQ